MMPLGGFKSSGQSWETQKRFIWFTKIIQGSGTAFTNFLHRLILAANKAISDLEARQMVIETLAFENLNTEHKKVIRALKVRALPMDK